MSRTSETPLTWQEWVFVGEYLKDWNASAAMRRVIAQGASDSSWAGMDGYRMTKKPNVAAEIERAREAVLGAIKLDVELVVKDIKSVLIADAEELSAHHNDCCRYCYGEDHEYQFTPAEWKRTEATHQKSDEFKMLGEPCDPQGGVGFDPRKEPVEDCPECNGRGVMTIRTVDTRKLSPAARALYAGVKPGKHGTEILMRSKDSAREAAAKWLGMNKETVNILEGNAKDLDDNQLAAVIAADKAKRV